MSILSDIYKVLTDRAEAGTLTHYSLLDDRGNAPVELPYVTTAPDADNSLEWNTNDRTMDFVVECLIYSKRTSGYATKASGALVDVETFMNEVVSDWDMGSTAMYLNSINVVHDYDDDEYVLSTVTLSFTSDEFEPGGM